MTERTAHTSDRDDTPEEPGPEKPSCVTTGTLYCIGIGPGDPELMTVKAARILGNAKNVAFFHKRGRRGTARTIAGGLIPASATELGLEYPMTTEAPTYSEAYKSALHDFYERTADDMRQRLDGGDDIVVLCEGDPFFYGSFMHLYLRLRTTHKIEVVPGVSGMSGCWTQSGEPITYGDDVLTVLPATLPRDKLLLHVKATDALVIMKLGRHLPKVRDVLREAGLLERAIYVERGTMPAETITPLIEKKRTTTPHIFR